MQSARSRLIGATILALAVTACEKNPVTVAQHDHAMPAAYSQVSAGQVDGLAKQLRQSISRYNATVQASQAGYAEASPCISAPPGAMGFHWVNNNLVDPVFDPMNPEAVLYEKSKNGQYKLVAVEYIVIDVGQPAPTFAGQPFDVGGTPVPVPHWSLHVWINKDNPNGMFNPWNPTVVCS